MTTVYFIRHAEPERSSDSKYNDRTYPLSSKGLADRKLVTEFLQDKNINAVLSSPFKRAVETVADFAEKNSLEIELIEDFRERAISDVWIDDFNAFAKNQWTNFSYKLDGGECLLEVQERNIRAFNGVLEQYKDKNIVIGTHGQALSVIINHFDKTYGFDDFMAMASIMPWVTRMDFDGDNLIGMWKIDLFNPNMDSVIHTVLTPTLGTYKGYAVVGIFARYKNQWLYARAKTRDVFEMIGGGIKDGETPLEAAKRELYEETGVIKYTITPICDYRGVSRTRLLNGQLFYAEIDELGELPEEHEMAEVKLFDKLPEKMRFPELIPVLFEKVKDLI